MAYNTYSFNPCAYHHEAPAVASCGVCGKALCSKCVDESVYTFENKPMCKDCTINYLSGNIEGYKKEISWSKIKLVVLIVFLVLGLVIYISDKNNVMTAWIIAGIGGIPSIAKGVFKKSAEEKAMDTFMVRTNAEDGCLQMLFAFIFRLALTMLLAPIAAIFFCIKNWASISKCQTALEKDQAVYNKLVSSAHVKTQGHQYQQPSQQYHSNGKEETVFASGADDSGVSLVFHGTRYPLGFGKNVVGRKAETSSATVQIPVDDLYMSRQHCIINVTLQSDGSVSALLSNYQNKNRTVVNGRIVDNQNNIMLNNGNQITLGRTNLLIEMV